MYNFCLLNVCFGVIKRGRHFMHFNKIQVYSLTTPRCLRFNQLVFRVSKLLKAPMFHFDGVEMFPFITTYQKTVHAHLDTEALFWKVLFL